MNTDLRIFDPTRVRAIVEAKDAEIAALKVERDRLDALINSPQTAEFLSAVRSEVAHQIERWGTVHDRAKEPGDWLWLLGYLANKALAAHLAGNTEKAKHHTISSAAVLANWWAHITLGGGAMTPGSSDLQAFLLETFGANFVEYQGGAASPPRLAADDGVLEGTNRTTSGAIGQP